MNAPVNKMTIDNYDTGTPDQLEVVDVLVRWWTDWRNSQSIFKREESTATYVAEIRNIFGCGGIEETDRIERLLTANHAALTRQYATNSVRSDTSVSLRITGEECLYIKRQDVTIKIPAVAVDSELLDAIAALVPEARWFGEDGGYAHAW